MIAFRTICLVLAVAFAISLSSAISFSDELLDTPIPKTVREKMIKMYDAASECLKLCSPVYASASRQKPELMMNFSLPFDRHKIIEVDGDEDIYMQVGASSMRLEGISYLNWKYKPPSGWQRTPALTRDAAIERAKEYLRIFKIDVPANYKLTMANFESGEHCWRVCWGRFSGQYLWEWERSLQSETVFVDFYEKEGLVVLSAHGCNCPEPKHLEVKISKEEAIAKATRCIPLLQRTQIYRSCRLDGFVFKSVKSCEVRVSAPNWWLDPKRAIFMSNGLVPKETRLCWRVKLETMDSKQEDRRRKGELGSGESLMSPEMTFYIDAATGEAVGADVI